MICLDGIDKLDQAYRYRPRNTILNRNDLSAKSVFDAVKADDSVAKEIAESFGNYLGRALANLAAVIDPSIFVIGGGVSKGRYR